MAAQPVKVLLIDDDQDSLLIARGLLSQIQGVAYEVEWAGSYEAGLRALRSGRYQACLLDYRLGAGDGLALLRQAIADGCRAPIIMMTGQGDREVDLQAMKAGAADFLAKDSLTAVLLERVLRYAIERHRAEEQRLRDDAHRRLITEHLATSLWTTDTQLRFTSSLGAGLLGVGLRPDELVGRSVYQHFQAYKLDHPVIAGHLLALEGQSAVFERDWRSRTYHVRLEPIRQETGHVVGTVGVAVDITESKRVAAGFRFARQIQQRLLPQAAPILPGFDIAGTCRPAEATGGDFFDCMPLPDGSLAIIVADVSSHGFGPALIMAETRRILRTLAAENNDPAAILAATNRAIVEDTGSDLFVTLFFAQVNPFTRTLSYVGAGHEGYLIDSSGTPRRLSSTAIPLGVVDETTFPCEGPVPLRPGEMLALLTDGFAEAMGPDNRQFGLERALDIISTQRARPAVEILDHLDRTVRDFCQPNSPHDDITAVIVKAQLDG